MRPHWQMPKNRTTPRRGVSTPLLLMCVMSVLLFVVLAIDLAQLSIQRQQMQCGADAATMAAAADLMDRRWLYLGPEGGAPNLQWLDQLPAEQAVVAFQKAQMLAASNRVAGQPIELGEDDVTFGQVSNPMSIDPAMEPVAQGDACNSIGIELTRSKMGGNPPVLWLARQTGLENIDVVVRSQACVDRRVHGFQPLRHVNVPIVPLGLYKHRNGGGSSAGSTSMEDDQDMPAELWWAKGPRDEAVVDCRAGLVAGGSDGIAEMVFRLRAEDSSSSNSEGGSADDKARRCALIGFLQQHLTIDQFARIAVEGAQAPDLMAYGGTITLGDDDPALVPADFSLPDEDISALCSLLESDLLLGKPRLWPVVADCSSAVGQPAVGIVGFVAGAVVECDREEDGSLLIVIQPCVLQTPTALTSEVAQTNPWIGKLLLIR